MRLKVTLRREQKQSVDLVVTAEPNTTLGVVANELFQRDPLNKDIQRTGESVTSNISIAVRRGRNFEPIASDVSLSESGIKSGDTIAIETTRIGGYKNQSAGVVTVKILKGFDAGKEKNLSSGTMYIGRDQSCDLVLNDQHVSKHHAKLHITDQVEIVDNNSANGTFVSGSSIQRAVIKSGDIISMGNTEFVVIQTNLSASSATENASVAFNRPPRINPYFEGKKFKVPDLPKRDRKSRFPIITMIAPLLMGVAIYFMTKSVMYVAFMALSPVMLVGNFVEGRVVSKKSFQEELKYFHQSLAELRNDLMSSVTEEQIVRSEEVPSVNQVIEAIERLSPLLWTRRLNERGFLNLRFGVGVLPSRTTVEIPDSVSKREEGYKEIINLMQEFKYVANVPVVAELLNLPSVGIAAQGEVGDSIMSSIILQICGLHSPSEVVLAVLTSSQSTEVVNWFKWLPHVSSLSSPLSVEHIATNLASSIDLLGELEEIMESRLEEGEKHEGGKSDEIHIVILVRSDTSVERSRLVYLSENGFKANIHFIWQATTVEQLPAACKQYIQVESVSNNGVAVYVDDGDVIRLDSYELVHSNVVVDISKKLSPIYDAGARLNDETDLPLSVSLLSILGPQIAVKPELVIERWQENSSIKSELTGKNVANRGSNGLRALVGQSATGPFYLDLRIHGPHALVGGTTGAGKSEFLQTWIMGMALSYSPDRVTFLLVDYKGGSAFGDCAKLKHTVGMVTDLSQHLARRALVSLLAELRYRERILNRKKAKDLLELERRGDPECPPSLLIIIDEFAALVGELPEFVDGVVDVAQRGRSLGLHLILATQRPAGVIKDNLRANTNLRIALRMADESDSTDVVGLPVAGSFDPSIPGRGIAKLGPGRLEKFQSGYVGGFTPLNPPPPRIVIEEMSIGEHKEWEDVIEPDSKLTNTGIEDIKRLTSNINKAADLIKIENPRKPWLPSLAPLYNLGLLETKRLDSELVFAVSDLPEEQSQPTTSFLPDADGNMIIFGTGASGKSTTLRSLAICCGFAIRGGPCHVYGLDYGSRGLQLIEELPHVGSIIAGDDIERTVRLLKMLRSEIDRRAIDFAKAKASTLTEYRKITSNTNLPRYLILIDGLQGFRQIYEGTDKQKWFDLLLGISGDGRPVGVHLIFTADRPAALPSSLGSSVQKKLVLRMAGENDLAILGVPMDAFDSNTPPGRGYMDNLEIQVAVFGGTSNLSEQANEVKKLSDSMRKAGVTEAAKIEKLSDRIRLSDLPSTVDDSPAVGIAEESLLPVGMSTSGTFILSGPPSSGRTTCFATLALSVRRWKKDAKMVYFGSDKSLMFSLLEWDLVATSYDDIKSIAEDIKNKIEMSSKGDLYAIYTEGISDFVNSSADVALQELAKSAAKNKHLFVVEGEISSLSGSWPLLQVSKLSRSGICLQPDQADGSAIYRTAFPRVNRNEFVPGRGLLISSGKTQILQVAIPE